MSTRVEGPELLTPAEVAKLFRVDPKTVTRWAKQGRLQTRWTPGGHRRYYADQVNQMLGATENPNPQSTPFNPRGSQ